MKDPSTLVGGLHNPIPANITKITDGYIPTSKRGVKFKLPKRYGFLDWSPFWILFGYEIYLDQLIAIWHVDPKGDIGPPCHYKGWKFHIWHWRIKFPIFYKWRRRLTTRCYSCGGRSTSKHPVNLHDFKGGPEPKHFWQRERHLRHSRNCPK